MQILTTAYENTQADRLPCSDTVRSNTDDAIKANTFTKHVHDLFSFKVPGKYNKIYTQNATSKPTSFRTSLQRTHWQ